MATAPGVTSVEVYGFVGWVCSAVAFVLYLLWAYVPDPILWWHGIWYYPSKYWAVAFPTWVCVSVVAAYWAYESLNTMSARSPGAAAAEGFVAGGQPDPAECQYFNAEGSTRILPLRVLPTELADLVLREGLAPHEAERVFKERLRARAAGQGAHDDGSGS